MSRLNCISNRNFKIIASYLDSKQGTRRELFDNLPYPSDRYGSPDDFFLDEDEWTSQQSFHHVFRKAKRMADEPYFYFHCGASSARYHSWGRLDYFIKAFSSPSDGYKRLPFFNRTFNNTKDIEIIIPPYYDKGLGKMRTVIKVQYHGDIDVNGDYITDPYRRGIISSIPTVWGLRPVRIKQPLNPYSPEILFNEEPEFFSNKLEVKMEKAYLTIKSPHNQRRKIVGQKIILEPDYIKGKEYFLGNYREYDLEKAGSTGRSCEALLISETITIGDRIIVKAGEIFCAPYFVLDITYDRMSLSHRLGQVFNIKRQKTESGKGLIETINRLRETIASRNQAYEELKKTNKALIAAKMQADDYAVTLEQKVEERTSELIRAKEELLIFNRDLKATVNKQVKEIERYNELRRYLSPRLTEKILSSGEKLGSEPQRKVMTVMFADIRNFSELTDILEPEEIFPLLNQYLSEMTKLVHLYEGTLNKIIGDGLLLFFGDPIPMDDHAQRAVRMAVDMQNKVSELKPEWLQYGYEFGVGIGINTGYMTVGNIGSDLHKDYTVIGNQVNVAARLESIAKAGQILISQRTCSRVEGLVELEMLGEIKVKGIHSPIVTYNVKP